MAVKIMVLALYFVTVLIIGLIARARWHSTPETYFLADRKLGTLVLLGTMVSTNFSAFTVFGTSGAGYRDGYAFFPIMGFGTGFMALTFWFLGRRIWRVGRDKGVLTPPELVGAQYGSRGLSALFALVMIVFTIPYLALQPMAAGYVLEELVGLPYIYGCVLVTAIICLYTLRGGMRAVAWTDLFQGTVMFVLLLISLILVANHNGGLIAANGKALAEWPELFSRPGGAGKYTFGIWFSYMALWFFCDPMFPQLFQRFFTARGERNLSRIMILYPLVCTVVFFMPICVGVLGRLSFPDLAGKAADRILPMVLTQISGDAMAALVMAAGLAALMSTMDSQLLTLSSIFSRDIAAPLRGKQAKSSAGGRIFVVFLSLAGLALAYSAAGYHPPDRHSDLHRPGGPLSDGAFRSLLPPEIGLGGDLVDPRRGGPGGLVLPQVAPRRAIFAGDLGHAGDLRSLSGGPLRSDKPGAADTAGPAEGLVRSLFLSPVGHFSHGHGFLGVGIDRTHRFRVSSLDGVFYPAVGDSNVGDAAMGPT